MCPDTRDSVVSGTVIPHLREHALVAAMIHCGEQTDGAVLERIGSHIA